MTASNRFITWTEALELEPPRYLVDGLIQEGGIGVTYGKAGSGKSLVTLDLLMCIATGRDWHGVTVNRDGPASAAYVAAEGTEGLSARLHAWNAEHGSPKHAELFPYLRRVDLLDEQQVGEFIGHANETMTDPAIVVFDTFAQCFSGNENSGKDMTQAVQSMKRVRDHTGAAVLAVHHTPISTNRRERGHGALRAATDSVIEVTGGNDTEFITVRNDRQRNQLRHGEWTFSIATHPHSDGRTYPALRLLDRSLGSDSPCADHSRVLVALASGQPYRTKSDLAAATRQQKAAALAQIRAALKCQHCDVVQDEDGIRRRHRVA